MRGTHGRFCWNELMAHDVDGARRFYADTMGWSVPDGCMPYISVDDVDVRVTKAVKAGAKVMKPAFDVPGIGRIIILMEPGAGVGWMTPAKA